jgi:hypothetical protein
MRGSYIDHENGSPVIDDGVDVVIMVQENFQVLHMNANIDVDDVKGVGRVHDFG